jgi:hypothetical protein
MSYAEIESELEKLTPDELRRLAVKSWSTFVEKEGVQGATNECDEDDPQLLAALDKAVERADAPPMTTENVKPMLEDAFDNQSPTSPPLASRIRKC